MNEGKKGPPVWIWFIVLIPVVLFSLGVVSALAIYGVRKYIVNAKQAEARAALVKWGDGLVQCGESEGTLPPSTTPVPASLSEVGAKKYMSNPAEWREKAHVCAGFAMTTPQYFQYSWELRTPSDGVLNAQADWDGDGSPDVSLDVPVRCSAGKCVRGTATGLDGARASGDASTNDDSGSAASSTFEWSPILIAFMVLTVIGVFGMLVGGFWMIGVAFTESVGWGLLTLFVPFGRLIFLVKHWEIGKRPFFVWLASLGLLLIGALFYGVGIALTAGRATAATTKPVIAPLVDSATTKVPPRPVTIPVLDGTAVDLSTVMGRARKLANQWRRDAALLGIEATLAEGKIQTQNGAIATLTFGPSPFEPPPLHPILFVVTYDVTGIHGAPAPGKVGPLLPEPMCAPERVLWRLPDLGAEPVTLSYALDERRRPTWLVARSNQPRELHAFDPQDCQERGTLPRPRW